MVKRFAAVQGRSNVESVSDAELGCFLSHRAAVNSATTGAHCLILEDDVLLPPPFQRWMSHVLGQRGLAHWDVLFLGQTIDFQDVRRVKDLIGRKRALGEGQYALLDGVYWYKWGTFAYVIHRESLAKIQGIFNAVDATLLEQPIDSWFGKLIRAKRLTSRIVFPYIVGLNTSFASSISDRPDNGDAVLHADIVNLFVRDADLSPLLGRARAEAARKIDDQEAFIVSQILHRSLRQ
jgi:hypothetical protein